jgi:hypothetical protein
VVLLKAFDELDQAAISLWNHLDDAIVKPRTEIGKRSLCSLKINENSIVIKQTPPDGTIEVCNPKSPFFNTNTTHFDLQLLIGIHSLCCRISKVSLCFS